MDRRRSRASVRQKPQKKGKDAAIVPLKNANGFYGMGIKWDDASGAGASGADLDLQAVVVDSAGLIVDTVYYNNLFAMDHAISHSGDQQSGVASGVDESVWVKLSKVPADIHLIIFVVCAFSAGCRLKDVEGGCVLLMEGSQLNRLMTIKIESSVANADVVGVFKRTKDGIWAFKEIDEPAEFGSHFVDIIEPCIGDIIRAEIPHAPAFQKVSFVTEKGGVASLPANSKLKRAFVGIGATLPTGCVSEVDIDLAAVFVDVGGNVIGAVDGEHDSLFGVEHSGDSVADDGQHGDDEALSIDLAQIPEEVVRIFITLTIHNGTFALVDYAYACIKDQNACELVRYDIDASSRSHDCYSGLVVGQLFATNGAERRWSFQAVGHFLVPEQLPSGQAWKGAVEDICRMVQAAKAVEGAAPEAAKAVTRRAGSIQVEEASIPEAGAQEGEKEFPVETKICEPAAASTPAGDDADAAAGTGSAPPQATPSRYLASRFMSMPVPIGPGDGMGLQRSASRTALAAPKFDSHDGPNWFQSNISSRSNAYSSERTGSGKQQLGSAKMGRGRLRFRTSDSGVLASPMGSKEPPDRRESKTSKASKSEKFGSSPVKSDDVTAVSTAEHSLQGVAVDPKSLIGRIDRSEVIMMADETDAADEPPRLCACLCRS